MIPVLFKIGPIPVHSFGLMVALAMFASVYRLAASFEQDGIDPRHAETFVFVAGITGLLGARFWYLIEYYDEIKGDFWTAAFASAGFTFYGGFVVAIGTLWITCRVKKVKFHRLFDNIGPAMAMGYAVGRVGCQLSGDGDYGIETSSFWGVSYIGGVVPTDPGVLVYPTPFFESVMALAICYVLVRYHRHPRLQAPFRRTGLWFSLLSVERFIIEFIRIKKRYAFGLSEAHYAAIIFILIGLVLIFRPVKAKEAV